MEPTSILAVLKPFASLQVVQAVMRWWAPFKMQAVFQNINQQFVLVSVINNSNMDVTVAGAGFAKMKRSWRTLWITRFDRGPKAKSMQFLVELYRSGEQRKKQEIPFRFVARERVMLELPSKDFPFQLELSNVNGVVVSMHDGKNALLYCPEVLQTFREHIRAASEQMEAANKRVPFPIPAKPMWSGESAEPS